MALPLRQLEGPVRALFSDLDGTLTTSGRVEASTYSMLEELGGAGVPVVLVTGRPSGWGQAIMTLVPVAAVVAENGGITYVRREAGFEKLYGVTAASLPDWQRRMREAAVDVACEFPGAQLTSDSRFREVDLAIDWNEDASLSRDEAEAVADALRKRGFSAIRSSLHVNFGPPGFNKLSACKSVVAQVLGGDPGDLEQYVYVGDALNDAPMFGGFPRSVGVANVRKFWDELPAKPRYITEEAEGAGLRQVVKRVLEITRS